VRNARETHPKELIDAPLALVDLKHLIIKLRWIGMEAEAEQLQRSLDHVAPGEAAALWPQSTD
jgi:hypothetical protein